MYGSKRSVDMFRAKTRMKEGREIARWWGWGRAKVLEVSRVAVPKEPRETIQAQNSPQY